MAINLWGQMTEVSETLQVKQECIKRWIYCHFDKLEGIFLGRFL